MYETGISYAGRTYAEGKKIGWRDGLRAMYSIARYSPILERFNGHPVVRQDAPVEFADADAELAESLDSLRDAKNYQDWIFELCEPYFGRCVLEVGAGHGDFTRLLADSAREVTALDPSERCTKILRDRFEGEREVEVVAGVIDAVPGHQQFDSVVLINVLEHIDDDLGALVDLRARLKPEGHLIVFVPAFDGLYSKFDRMIGHRRRYRRSHMVVLADRAGFDIIDSRYVNSVGAFVWWLFARRLHQIPTSTIPVKMYDRGVVPLLRRIEADQSPKVGQSVLLIGRPRGRADAPRSRLPRHLGLRRSPPAVALR